MIEVKNSFERKPDEVAAIERSVGALTGETVIVGDPHLDFMAVFYSAISAGVDFCVYGDGFIDHGHARCGGCGSHVAIDSKQFAKWSDSQVAPEESLFVRLFNRVRSCPRGCQTF